MASDNEVRVGPQRGGEVVDDEPAAGAGQHAAQFTQVAPAHPVRKQMHLEFAAGIGA